MNINDLVKRHEQGMHGLSSMDDAWRDIGDYISPRKNYNRGDNSLDIRETVTLYDSTAVQANQTMAQGQMSYVSPMEERWFAYEPKEGLKAEPSAQRFYAECSSKIAELVYNSNFYSEIHELYLDRSAYGTGCILVMPNKAGNGFNFQTIPIGSYWICENSEKIVDTVFRELKMTARQMSQEFGDDVPEEVSVALKNMRQDEKFTVVHAVFPREDRVRSKKDPINKPFASIWFTLETKQLLRESGFDSNPYCVTRYLKWGDSPWGWSPSWMCMADVKQLNALQESLDVLAEVMAFPRMLIPSDLEGEVDITAGGFTLFNPHSPSQPKEWLTGGRYESGFQRAEAKQKSIREAFHYDLFKMFAQLEKQMTAMEISARQSEKLVQFSPTFARMTTELFNPLLQRAFALANDMSLLPEAPESVIGNDGISSYMEQPAIEYKSKIALAIRSQQASGFMRMMEAVTPIMQIDPSLRHLFKMKEASIGLARTFGVPETWMSSEEEYDAKIQQEQQAQQAQQEAEMMSQGAQALGALPENMQNKVAQEMM